MTDTERIKRLAEWMGWKFVLLGDGEPRIVDPNPNLPYGYIPWNPLERIRDAWMLVEKAEQHPDEILFKMIRMGTERSKLHWYAEFRVCGNVNNPNPEYKQGEYFWAGEDTPSRAIVSAIERLMEWK